MKFSLLPLLCTGLLLVTISCNTTGTNTASKISPQPRKNISRTIYIEKTGNPTLDQALDYYETATSFCAARNYDAALAALDQSYELAMRADARTPLNLKRRDELRLTIANKILEVNSAKRNGIRGTYSAIQVPVDNPYVAEEIRRLTGPERQFFTNAYRRSGQYNEYILKKLRENGLPEELAWIPLIESGYQVQALSPARALGLWQFIPSTGVRYGLKRELLVDERMDPEKSTDAAIAYLMALHDMFGDWPTVLAAYNCGEGRVRNTIQGQNVNYLDNFWDLYTRLPRETARYVPRFLATIHIVNNMEKYGFDRNDLHRPTPHEKVTVARRASLKDIANATGICPQELKALNPALRYDMLPGEHYQLKVPPGYTNSVLASIESIQESSAPSSSASYSSGQSGKIRHKVKRGETLSTIASRYKVPVARLMKENGIRKASSLPVGKVLVISNGKAPVSSSSARASTSTGSQAFTYTVKKGDTLGSIASRYNTDVKRIMSENRLSRTNLKVNQKLRIPGTAQKVKTAATTREDSRSGSASTSTAVLSAGIPRDSSAGSKTETTFAYTVKKGDTLGSLAKRFGTDVNSIKAANNLSGTNLRVNQKLRIPGTGQQIKSASSAKGKTTYVVKSGDSPFIIAEKHNIPLNRFLELNNMNSKSTIHPGQKVYIE